MPGLYRCRASIGSPQSSGALTAFAIHFYARQCCWIARNVAAIGNVLVPANCHFLMSRTPARTGVLRPATLLLALCLTTGWTSSAKATCGDYLHRDLPLQSPAAQANTTHQPLPCQGPGCRRSEFPSTPVAPTSLERTTDQGALLAPHNGGPGDGRAERTHITCAPPATGFASRIDRPPR